MMSAEIVLSVTGVIHYTPADDRKRILRDYLLDKSHQWAEVFALQDLEEDQLFYTCAIDTVQKGYVTYEVEKASVAGTRHLHKLCFSHFWNLLL